MCIRDKLNEGKSLSKFYQIRCNKPEKAEGSEIIELFIKDVPKVPVQGRWPSDTIVGGATFKCIKERRLF